MVEIWLEFHAQTHHNAAGLASGHYDIALTDFGRTQARTVLRARHAHQAFDAAYTSDTQRAYDTACLMFEGRDIPIAKDARLRECDYGALEGRPRPEMEAARLDAIDVPFPKGESYAQVAQRMRSFLVQLAAERAGQTVMLVGHAATMYALDHLLRARTLREAILLPSERPYRYVLGSQLSAAAAAPPTPARRMQGER